MQIFSSDFLFQKKEQESLQGELSEYEGDLKTWRKVAEDRRQEMLQFKLEVDHVSYYFCITSSIASKAQKVSFSN